jgi:NAD(P)-dependent dehydrogenase (short-subunit alcohol dehydrogenase family)
MKLNEKVALVTGAGQGMGRAIARQFAAEGARVVALDLNLDAARETLDGLAGVHMALGLNVSDSSAVNDMVDQVVQAWGRVDILVNNAGTGGMDTFTEMSDEAWARVMGVNLYGAFYCARAATRIMVKNASGVVINIGSTAAVSGDGPAHYVTSKAAIMGLTRVMAKELAKSGIRVNTLVPGPTNTPMMQGIPKEWADAIIAGVPMGRMAEPDDIAKVALFLASDDSGFVTGQSLAVNGGSAFL